MNVVFLQRSGINLYHTLLASETSRRILRFYHPEPCPGGVIMPITSFSSALSLANELRWYIRRYMQDVLFEVAGDAYCTLALAREVYYDREITTLNDTWPFRRLYVIRNGNLISAGQLSGRDKSDNSLDCRLNVTRLIVLCSEQEYNNEKIITTGEQPVQEDDDAPGDL